MEDADETDTMVLQRQLRVFVSPDGQARVDSLNHGIMPVNSTEIVTSHEVSQFVAPSNRRNARVARQLRLRNGIDREIEDYFGRPYPQEALALLNPLLLLRDYVCVSGTGTRTTLLDYNTVSYRLAHNPDFPVDATDDPERLGSMTVDVTFNLSDPLMLLSWSALHANEPFSTTRVTWLRQGVDLDPAIFTDPRVPAPVLPFD